MIIKNISGSSQDIDIGTAVVTVANNALVALDPGYRWQVNGIYGSKFRVATAAEVGSAGSVASVDAALTAGNPITVDNTDPANPLIDIPVATTLAGGYISAADWNTFNAKLTPVLTSANILVGNGSNVATPVAMSGDATIDNTGAVTVSGATGAFTVGGALTNTAGTQAVTFYPIGSNPQALSGAGAINTTTYQTQFTSTATGNALTLASVTQVGQVKKISYIAEAAGADTGVITPTATVGFTTATLNSVGDYVVLSWAGAGWAIIDYVGVTLA